MSEDWMQAWQPMVDAVGRDFSTGDPVPGADPVERSTIRRWLEPLEFDCALHYDPEVARAYGHPDVIAPYASLLMWTIPAMWSPGQRLFDSAERNAQPTTSPINDRGLELAPPTTGFFATDMEMDFVRAATVGEHLSERGRVLLSCVPKQTAVGRGAFMTWQSEIVDATGDVLARVRVTLYAYQPVAAEVSA
ncbi:MAG TPA: MaoC family dehydratase N-terminal domain-containing protein [Mycobacteriales bacterium]|jgi:hypothetical protein|nr:MaoC family dehydratase N-terminal domain-containing protein [Mycobacteriales bacterium]